MFRLLQISHDKTKSLLEGCGSVATDSAYAIHNLMFVNYDWTTTTANSVVLNLRLLQHCGSSCVIIPKHVPVMSWVVCLWDPCWCQIPGGNCTKAILSYFTKAKWTRWDWSHSADNFYSIFLAQNEYQLISIAPQSSQSHDKAYTYIKMINKQALIEWITLCKRLNIFFLVVTACLIKSCGLYVDCISYIFHILFPIKIICHAM